MDINTPINNILNDLRTNVKDPIGREGQWIHYDEVSEVGKTPAVYLDPVDATPVGIVGASTSLKFLRLRIHVVVGVKDNGVIDGVRITSSKKLRDTILKKITERLDSQSRTLNCVFDTLEGTWPVSQYKRAVTVVYRVEI